VLSAKDALDEAVIQVDGLNSAEELTYLIGTGYGRNKVPFADENISEISCHAMGVHVTDPSVKAIIDIGGQDVKGIAIDTDGTVLNFAMNDKCAAGTGRFFESMARAFEMSLDEFSNLSLTAKNVIPITAQCAVFAESEVICCCLNKNTVLLHEEEFKQMGKRKILFNTGLSPAWDEAAFTEWLEGDNLCFCDTIGALGGEQLLNHPHVRCMQVSTGRTRQAFDRLSAKVLANLSEYNG